MRSVVLNSNSNSPLRDPTNDSDIDFADVFGGPPRRRSMLHDVIRHSFSSETADSYGSGVGGALIPRRPMWFGESDEKPVFGDETANRRRFTTDGFFNDIFRGTESSSIGSPRMSSERDPFGSTPGSRVLSPTRPLPTKAEPSGTSLPAQFSLPAKLIKATENPTFGSPTRSLSKNRDTTSSSPLSRSSSQTNLNNVSSPKPESDDVPEVPGRAGHFHFSIYKWPNKGVPTVLWGGSRLKAMAKAADEEITLQPTTTLSDTRSTSDEKVGEDEGERSSQSNVQTERNSLSSPPVSGVMEAREANVKPLHSFFADEEDGQGEDVLANEEMRKGKSRGKNTRHSSGDSRNKKKPQGRRSSLDSAKPEKSSVPGSYAKPREGSRDGVKGKVKEFVKIFNQGGSAGTGGESLGQSSRWRAKESTIGTDVNKSTSVNETAQMSNEQKTPSSDSSATGQHPPQVWQEKESNTQNIKSGTHGVSGQEWRQEPSAVQMQSTPEETDESFHLNFQVKEITQDENKLEQTGNEAEEIQNIDAKIRKWSQGKDGNIRSLLSTLQYILWPGSGWKPVPLMDLIEGNAVRRSYQKALLILHPDKLQQKGASANQKYTAEKVFELLQEAWDFFNLVGQI